MATSGLRKRYCVDFDNGERDCYVDDGFWYTTKGVAIKWAVLGTIFLILFVWFIGGYVHAKRRLRAGKPLMKYHRFLVSRLERNRNGQAGVPQSHFTFYQPNAPYQQRQDGAWSEPPPTYQNNDAPPQYFAPPGPAKVGMAQNGMEMPRYGGQQTSGVMGGAPGGATQAGVEVQNAQLPPRPQPTKGKFSGILERFRR